MRIEEHYRKIQVTEKICTKCGEVKKAHLFYSQKKNNDGLDYWCKPCHNKYTIEHRIYSPEKKAEYWKKRMEIEPEKIKAMRKASRVRCKNSTTAYENSPHGRFIRYRHDSARRGKEFNITETEFYSFYDKPCYYCGVELPVIALDRVNNDLGYSMGNIVPCCTFCNLSKRDLTKSEFIALCYSVVKHHEMREAKKEVQWVDADIRNGQVAY